MAPILTNDRILDASKYATANNAEAFMDKKEEKVKNVIFEQFDIFFGIYVVLLHNLTDIFAATDNTFPINIKYFFEKALY